MAGRLISAFPSRVKDPTGSDWLQACYFIVLEHPLASIGASTQGTVTPLTGRLLRKFTDAFDVSDGGTVTSGNHVDEAALDDATGVRFMVITVDNISGQLLHTGIPGKDLFPSVQKAIEGIPSLCPSTPEPCEVFTILEFVAFAGACLTEDRIYMLFIEAGRLVAGSTAHGSHISDNNEECVPPIVSVERARWYTVPLRVAVPALQQPLTDKGLQSWVLGPSGGLRDATAMAMSAVPRQPYLLFCPGVDISHCGVFEKAVRACAGHHEDEDGCNGSTVPPTACQGEADVTEGSTSLCAQVLRFLPPPPTRTGREALGHCDCLWNEELIAFCDIFGIADCCCRLAFGSFTMTTMMNSQAVSHEALLLVRLSRLALPGCVTDRFNNAAKATSSMKGYTSAHEAEFQLILVPMQGLCGPNVENNNLYTMSSLTWRRGGDFAGHEEIVQQRQRVDYCTARGMDPLPTVEDHVAAIFSSYQQRYGVGTEIALMHAGCWALLGAVPSCSVRKGGGRVSSRVNVSRESSRRREDSKGASALPLDDAVGGSEVLDSDSATNELQGRLQLLASHVSSHSLRPTVFVGNITTWGSSSPCQIKKSGIVDPLWGRGDADGCCNHSNKETTCEASRMPGSVIPRVCVSNSGEVSAVASAVVSLVIVTVWLFSKFYKDKLGGELLQREKVTADQIINLVLNSAAGLKHAEDSCSYEEIVLLLHECLLHVVETVPVSFSPHIWETARRIVFLYRSSGDRGLSVEGGATKNERLSCFSTSRRAEQCNPFHAFVMSMFSSSGGFYQREFVRHRTRLLTHLAGQSCVIGAQLLFLTAESEGSSKVVSEACMDGGGGGQGTFHSGQRYFSNPPISEEGDVVGGWSTGAGGPPMPISDMLQSLGHPFSQPLLLPPRIAAVEFTVSLPSFSYITHVALWVTDASERGPFSAALTLSLRSSCYVGQKHERLVLDNVPLPLCRGGNASAHAGPHLIFFELPRLGCGSAPFSVLREANPGVDLDDRSFCPVVPVVARFLRYTLRGSGRSSLAAFPLLVFGEPLHDIPHHERKTIGGWKFSQRQSFQEFPMFFLHKKVVSETPLLSLSSGVAFDEPITVRDESDCSETNFSCVTETAVRSMEECQFPAALQSGDCVNDRVLRDVYTRKLFSSYPRGVFALDLTLLFYLESKRHQCRQGRFFRNFCFQKLGLPLWTMRPSSQMFPHSAVHPSRVPESFEDFSRVQLSQHARMNQFIGSNRHSKGVGALKATTTSCEGCALRSLFGFGLEECDRCKRNVCCECRTREPVHLPDCGILSATSLVCRKCLERVEKLENILLAYNVTKGECEDLDSETERDEAFEFYAPTVPLSQELFPVPYSNYGFYCVRDGPCHLTAVPFSRVVSAPNVDNADALQFEEVLGSPVDVSDTLGGWRCITEGMGELPRSRLLQEVVILLPHRCVVSYGVVRYQLSGKPQGCMDIRMCVKDSLQTVSPLCVNDANGAEVSVRVPEYIGNEVTILELPFQRLVNNGVNTPDDKDFPSFARGPEGVIISLVFSGSPADLALLCVKHFSVWGHFVASGRTVHSHFYDCAPDICRYESPKLTDLKNVSFPPAAACLPRALAEKQLIKPKSVVRRLHMGRLLVEHVFNVSVSICGFILEGQHPGLVSGPRGALPAALRLIGVTEDGFRGNIGYFLLPWPPLAQRVRRSTGREVFGYTYAFTSPVHSLVSVMIEVAEWRMAKNGASQPTAREVCNPGPFCNEGDNDVGGVREPVHLPEVHLGKVVFWTSPSAETRRIVSSNAYSTIFSGPIAF